MAPIPESVRRTIRDYVRKINYEIPVTKAVIFGSFAKGDFDEGRDIDLAIFSDHFDSMTRVEGIRNRRNGLTVLSVCTIP